MAWDDIKSTGNSLTAAEWNAHVTDQKARLANVVEDTTPQLGGNLDLNSNNITGTGNINITGSVTSSAGLTVSNGSTNNVATFSSTDDVARITISDDDTSGYFGVFDSKVFFGLSTTAANNPYIDATEFNTNGKDISITGDLTVTNSGTTDGIFIDQNGNGVSINIDSEATTAPMIKGDGGANARQFQLGNPNQNTGWDFATYSFYRNEAAAATAGALLSAYNANASDDQPAIQARQEGTGYGIAVDQNGNGRGLYVDTAATSADGIYSIANAASYSGSAITGFATGATNTGYAGYFANTGTSTGKGVFVQNEGTGAGITVDQNGNGTAFTVDSEATTVPAMILDIVDGDAHIRLVGDSGNATPTEGDFWRESDGLKYYDGTTEHNLLRETLIIAASDETTALTTGTAKVTFRMPYAMTLTEVRASLTGAGSTSGTTTVDINEGGTTILSTKLTIDAGEKTSTTAATAAVISDSALADDAEITIDIDAVSGGANETGLKVYLIGYRA